jgi:pilus assembly protein CpaB
MRSRTIILLIFFALVLAAVASGMVTLYLKKQVTDATAAPLMEPVVVSMADLSFGHNLEEGDLKVVMYPAESVPKGAVSQVDSLIGKTTKVFLAQDEPILETKLSDVGGGLSLMIEPPMRGVSISVDRVSGVSGFVLPGDRVDVIAIVDQAGKTNDALAKTILQNVEVLAAGEKTEQKGNAPITVQSVTLLVDRLGAEKLALALREGRLHLSLRNPNDVELVEETAGLTKSELLSGPKKPTPPKPQPKPRPRPKPKPKEPEPEPVKPDSVTIIRVRNAERSEPMMQTPQPDSGADKPGQ